MESIVVYAEVVKNSYYVPLITSGVGKLRALGGVFPVIDIGRLTPPSYIFSTSSKPLNSFDVVFKYIDSTKGPRFPAKAVFDN